MLHRPAFYEHNVEHVDRLPEAVSGLQGLQIHTVSGSQCSVFKPGGVHSNGRGCCGVIIEALARKRDVCRRPICDCAGSEAELN